MFCARSKLPCVAAMLMLAAGMTPTLDTFAGTQVCPPTLVTVGQQELYQNLGGSFTVPGAAYDSTIYVGYGHAQITFDRHLALVSSSVASAGWFTASVRVDERFDLTGVAAGTAVDATLFYTIDGWAEQHCGASSCGVHYWATITCGTDSVSADDASQYGPGDRRTYVSRTLALPITLIAGTPIEATFSLNYWTARFADIAQAQGSGHYGVTGLPPGVHAFSCYRTDVTPVNHRTWGSVKLRYR